MNNTMKTMMAVAAFGLATEAQAQYYNFDVTVHQDPSVRDMIATQQMIDQQNQMINQQNIQRFYNAWVYKWDNGKKRLLMTAVPGLGAA
jgi:hypothetical protein